MPRARRKSSSSWLLLGTLIGVGVVIAILYLAQEFLKPIALSILLCFILAPGCQWLERRLHFNRVLSTLTMVGLSGLVVFAVGYIVTAQVSQLAADFPAYRSNIDKRVEVVSTTANRLMQRGTQLARSMRESVSRSDGPTSRAAVPIPGSHGAAVPLPPQPSATSQPTGEEHSIQRVEVVRLPQSETSSTMAPPWSSLTGYFSPIFDFLGTLAIIVVFVVFMLIQKEDLRDRLISLLSRRRIGLTTDALDDAASRVSRYLLMLCVVNGSYGLIIAAGLWLIGVPAAALWGLLCALLRFIPYIGPWIAAAFPILLSVAVGESWWMPVLTVSMFVVVELVSNNVMEPVLYGRGTGVSPMAVIIAAVFWTWLWGAPGLLMATPLTVCAAVAGKHVRALNFLYILLGDQPALPASLRYYQRLLANDEVESAAILRAVSEEAGLLAAFEEIALPSLINAERDARKGWIEPSRFREVLTRIRSQVESVSARARSDLVVSTAKGEKKDESGTCELPPVGQTPLRPAASVDLFHAANQKRPRHKLRLFRRRNKQIALGDKSAVSSTGVHPSSSGATTNTAAGVIKLSRHYPPPLRLPRDVHPRVLILPARDEPDEIAGLMLAGLLDLAGYQTEVLSIDHLASEMSQKVSDVNPDLIIISTTPPTAVVQARYLHKRVPREVAPVLFTVWSPNRPVELLQRRLNQNEKLPVANTLCTAIEQTRLLSASAINRLINRHSMTLATDPLHSTTAP